jgi:hypothetical protein
MSRAIRQPPLAPLATEISRRALLRAASVSLVGGNIAAAGLARLGAAPVAAGAVALRRSTFAPLVGAHFTLLDLEGEGPRSLRLFKLRNLRAGARATPSDAPETSFSLLFRGPPAPALPQATYTLAHAQIGSLLLLLAPMRPEADARFYEAVIDSSRPH